MIQVISPRERAKRLCEWLGIKIPKNQDDISMDAVKYNRILDEFKECEKMAIERDALEKAELERY